MTLKLIAITILALLLLIPLGMIKGKVHERDHYRSQAGASIAQSWTGAQVFYTPVFVQPYVVEKHLQTMNRVSNNFVLERTEERRYRFVPATDIQVRVGVHTERRQRGIYSFPVYTADIKLEGQFGDEQLRSAVDEIKRLGGFLRLETPWIAIAVDDPRGFTGIPTINVNNKELHFNSGTGISDLPQGLNLKLADTTRQIDFSTSFSLRGMESLQFVPLALAATINLDSSWPHPEFFGATLPSKHRISAEGMQANWQVTQFSTGVISKLEECQRKSCESLKDMGFGVKLIEGVDVYLQSMRAIKYGILFIGLSFITFFIYETLKNLRIHSVQYALVGLAIAVFYLLLVSLSEHIAYVRAYLLSTLACVSLLTYYIRFVLGGWKDAFFFAALYLALYGILYVIIQSEDSALLMGSALIFSVLAGIMVVTRNIDWYAFNPGFSAAHLGNMLKARKSETD